MDMNNWAEKEPEGDLETILVECIVSSLWRLKRALKVESFTITDDNKNLGYSGWVLTWQSLGH